ncbi:uncharacterized protein LOC124918258 [Impatiens glandulifera]|uniref:uncharacterized protein LOC124918258 n=1 Tax=Impatiens glandulifera TaxID=253017 RepID=UPI001FB12E72|nr:uncharacterized protein LOC124918258 [Impatiens glandulifera]
MTESLNSNSTGEADKIKFLYSYGGKIYPRHSDGKLRYFGGHTRILAVDCLTSFTELMMKFGESCGFSVSLKCKLPNEDLDVLVSVTSDDDLANIIDEYNRHPHQDLKIRAILFPLKSIKQVSPSVSAGSSIDSSGTTTSRGRFSPLAPRFPMYFQKVTGDVRRHPCCGEGSFSQSYTSNTPRWNHT